MTSLLFSLLVLAVFLCCATLLKKASPSYKKPLLYLSAWLLFTATLASTGILMNFESMPPRIILVILPAFAMVVYSIKGKAFIPLISNSSLSMLTLIQSFRIGVELILFQLAASGTIAHLLTWEGRNYDIIIGLSAPIMALLFHKKIISKRGLLFWNFFGILMVLNVFIHGLLSAPTMLQLIMTDPVNTFVATVPYVWLPTFLVPVAVILHILSIRKILVFEPS